ncbi:MAG TPA: acyl-CoA dehydrogenase family protein, partial [Novosphingobium sp.]|nr:acyl-CoA dehydrogenase family protein [Novosphingobium sp.]
NAEGQLARLELDAAPAERLPVSPAAAADALLVARLALLARALGAARAGFDLALEHARTRTQFGQPIGRFQAVQHKLANSFIALEGATAHLAAVAEAHDGDAAGWQARAEAALLFAGPALRQVALDNHHVLGAIGYAEEHAAPHLTRRIEIDTTLLGGTAAAREALAAHVIDRAAPLVAPGAGPADGFRQELRHWLGQHWGPAQRAANLARPFSEQNWDAAFARALGEAGLTTLTWPQAAGGRGASPLEKLAFLEETQAVAAPVQHTTVASWIVGPELLVHGNPRLCAALLEPIRRGEVSFCLGYSEPGAGSDLAALATRARREGDEYVISGHKLWNTDGHRASHIILAARTDPDARPRHAGISLFLIPMDTPGISVRPGMAFYGHHFSEILLDEVRVVDWMRLGPENGGWQILGKALANERIIMASFGTDLAVLLDAMMAAARAQGLLADGATRARLATLAAEVETARLLALGAILPRPDGPAPMVAAAVGKVFAGELGEALAQAGIELLGPAALLSQGEEGALAGGSIEQMLRRAIMMVIGGGTAEIQRNIIALRGLELPK